MKKAGVITYFYYYNYGTMLQGYALCRVIERLGQGEMASELIDCRFEEKQPTKSQLVKIRIKRLFVYVTQLKRIYKLSKYKRLFKRRQTLFDQFVKDYCRMSPSTYRFSEDLEVNPPIYDIYITGSDQTWSPKVGLRDSLFLGFAPEGSVRASYAPSVGVVSFTEEQRTYFRKRLAKYQFVSCREKYGTELLNDLSPVEVETVLDPTLVVSAEEWRKIASQRVFEGDYIFCYFIGDKPYYRRFAKQLSSQLNLPLVYLPVSYLDFSQDSNLIWESGPREFLSSIDNARVVLTDSFHGTIFSINFNKSFYSFVKHAGLRSMDNMRIVDILERMDLLDRLKERYDGGEIDYSEIDYVKTNQLLAIERSNSEAFINRFLHDNM